MIVCIIPARGGSRRIPRKNIRDFHGKPIIAYSIEAARLARIFDRVIVNSDDAEILDVAKNYGAEGWRRFPYLARDEIGTQEVMRDVLRAMPPVDYACCLYPCAPLLSAQTLRRAYEMLASRADCNYVVPVGTWLRDPGQFYFGRASAFLDGEPLLSERTAILPISPATDCDINTEEDWQRAEKMYEDFQCLT